MVDNVVIRSIVYFLVCYLSYQALSWASPPPDYSPKGIVLMDRYATPGKPIPVNEVRIFPFQPENAETVAWINIEKSANNGLARKQVEQKARQLAASVGANGVILLGEGDAAMEATKYPLLVLRAKAVKFGN